jgi:8-oxo-dGTP pyrophosphatase MutT (NUDIX family)
MHNNDLTAGENPWQTVSTQEVFVTPWIKVENHAIIKPNGAPGQYGVVRFAKVAVGVLPISYTGEVHLVGQWRYPLHRYSWEMPEGGAEPDEDIEGCARREMAEESGLACAHLLRVLEFDTSNSVTDEQAVIFIGYGLSPASGALDDTEVIERRVIPFADALAAALSGQIRDALTVMALLRAHHMAVSGALPPELARAMLGR